MVGHGARLLFLRMVGRRGLRLDRLCNGKSYSSATLPSLFPILEFLIPSQALAREPRQEIEDALVEFVRPLYRRGSFVY